MPKSLFGAAAFGLFLGSFFLTGCGQKGALYLPNATIQAPAAADTPDDGNY